MSQYKIKTILFDLDGTLVDTAPEMYAALNILLDEDAQQQALYYTVQYQNQGIDTKNIKPTDKDASDMGFTEVNNKLKESKQTGFGDIISQKLKGL